MSISNFIEKHFWIILIAGLISGLWYPVHIKASPALPKILLGMMLFLVFLKIDALEILEHIRNLKLMAWVTLVYMFIIPLLFYFTVRLFDPGLATAILLLTAMPAGVSTAALTDIVKGNAALSMSLTIVTQMVAPFTVPLLFWMIGTGSLEINKLLVFRDIAILVFVPLIVAQLIKKFFPAVISKTIHLFTSANVFLLFSFVYVAISSQRKIILENPAGLIWQIAFLYLVFIILHVIGYFACYRRPKEDRIAVAVGAAYMNNGMAIVLAAAYFSPAILILMVLSEIPWNTLLAPFRTISGKL